MSPDKILVNLSHLVLALDKHNLYKFVFHKLLNKVPASVNVHVLSQGNWGAAIARHENGTDVVNDGLLDFHIDQFLANIWTTNRASFTASDVAMNSASLEERATNFCCFNL